MEDVKKNEHLVWDLTRLSDHERATRFAMRFQESLCVYSPPVGQLYTNYEIIVPEDNRRKLIILPNPNAYHDTFNNINEDAVAQTRMFIVPDARGGLQLLITMSNGTQKAMPLGVGLNFIQGKLGPNVPFLPVLTKGDLREFSPSLPMLHLHRLCLDRITGHSDMEVRTIRKVIQDNLIRHFGFNAVGKAALA